MTHSCNLAKGTSSDLPYFATSFHIELNNSCPEAPLEGGWGGFSPPGIWWFRKGNIKRDRKSITISPWIQNSNGASVVVRPSSVLVKNTNRNQFTNFVYLKNNGLKYFLKDHSMAKACLNKFEYLMTNTSTASKLKNN